MATSGAATRKSHRVGIGADVLRRIANRWTWLLLVGALYAIGVVAGCADPVPMPGSTANRQPVESAPADGLTLVVSVGDHLEETEFEVDLQSELEASEDAELVALPGRSKDSAGKLYSPSQNSPTEESFWIHVFTDQSMEAAIEWVRYLASQPPASARIIVPQNHDLFAAAFQGAPNVGEASVSIELLHGHSTRCWRSALLVFAQNGVIVFMKSALPIGNTCDDSAAIAPLTDMNQVAFDISEQLAEWVERQ